MAWGRGKSSAYPWHMANGRGFRTDLAQMLQDDSFAQRLNNCRVDLENHRVQEAYTELCRPRISGLGSAFFTKFLYFLGRSLSDSWDYPIILDARVSETVACLTG